MIRSHNTRVEHQWIYLDANAIKPFEGDYKDWEEFKDIYEAVFVNGSDKFTECQIIIPTTIINYLYALYYSDKAQYTYIMYMLMCVCVKCAICEYLMLIFSSCDFDCHMYRNSNSVAHYSLSMIEYLNIEWHSILSTFGILWRNKAHPPDHNLAEELFFTNRNRICQNVN